MAITYTRSKTKTVTRTRIATIKDQFRLAFMRLMEYSKEQYSVYLEAIEEKAIKSISFYAYSYENAERIKWAQLKFVVDWEKHQELIESGKELITYKESFEGYMPETTIGVEDFEQYIEENGLYASFSVEFSPVGYQKYDYYMDKLGLVSGKRIAWRKDSNEEKDEKMTVVKVYSPRILEEFHMELSERDE